MKFYSYAYLLSKVDESYLVEWIISGVIIGILLFSLFKYYKDKRNSKYRELAIIAVMGGLLMIGIKISDYQSTAISSNQYRSSVKFIENIADHLNVDKNKIYINSEASIENSFVKVNDDYYRVISSGKKDDYLLEKIQLIDPQVEKVEKENE